MRGVWRELRAGGPGAPSWVEIVRAQLCAGLARASCRQLGAGKARARPAAALGRAAVVGGLARLNYFRV